MKTGTTIIDRGRTWFTDQQALVDEGSILRASTVRRSRLCAHICEAGERCLVDRRRLEEWLLRMASTRVAVVGDGCLDVYWLADMRLSELSRETPHFPLPVSEERMSLGAGSNVAVNASRLSSSVAMATVIGEDWRGREWRGLLHALGLSDEFAISASAWITPAYCKPLRGGWSDVRYEDPRIDFANRLTLPDHLAARLEDCVRALAADVDVMIVSDQFACGVMAPGVIDAVNRSAMNGGRCFVDSRYRLGQFRNAVLKPNRLELLQAMLPERILEDVDSAALRAAAVRLGRETNSSVCVTLGEDGSLWAEQEDVHSYPAAVVRPPLDIVGAGDAFLAALAVASGAGANRDDAVYIATLAAGVAVGKTGATGSASAQEILAMYDSQADGGEM